MEDRKKENSTIIRVVKSDNYTVVNNSFLRLKNLSLKAKGLMTLCLSLPDNWAYSIQGLITLSSDGRASVTSALNELKEAGFLTVTFGKNEKGFFKTVYTFYESPDNKPKDEKPQNKGVVSGADFLHREICIGKSASENQQQINTNNKILKQNKENENLLKIKKSENLEIFEAKDVFALYKEICKDFPQPSKLTAERIKKTAIRLKTYPKKEFWKTVFEIAQNSPFLKGEKGVWFNYDWLMKNDNNALKVFEGNYGGKNYVEKSQTANNTTFEGDKYQKKYGG